MKIIRDFQEGISGLELSNRMDLQAKKFGVQVDSPEKAVELRLERENKIVRTDKRTYNVPTLILALGNIFRQLNVPGEKEFRGRGVSYCATCDGHFFKGKKVLVIGGGNNTAETAIHLSALASEVKMIHHGDFLRAEDALLKQLRNNGVNVILNTVVKEIKRGKGGKGCGSRRCEDRKKELLIQMEFSCRLVRIRPA